MPSYFDISDDNRMYMAVLQFLNILIPNTIDLDSIGIKGEAASGKFGTLSLDLLQITYPGIWHFPCKDTH